MYAILTALEMEAESFIEKTSSQTIHTWNNYRFVIGTFAGQDCIIGYTGIGKVHTAVVVSHIIENYDPSIVFYTGIAGALRSDLNIGDVVIAKDSMQWDIDITSFGFKSGELPSANSSLNNKTYTDNVRFCQSDPELLKNALQWSPGGFKVKQGRIITGDSFFTKDMQSEKKDLVKEIDGYAVDMEGAAAGAVCKMHNIPFFLARVISDTVSGTKPQRFKPFMEDSSGKMAELIETIMRQL
ncbi:MAG: 5'-methylthioadenosine/adenosylhomocysteine nucleosidase [Spirochaetales bacterium]|nr:5'-methylthioadenosine/adenosylhomocysteine nucleosidase [Spirochaetales bacterium]